MIATLLGRSRTVIRSFLADPEAYGAKISPGRPSKKSPANLRRLYHEASRTGNSSTKLKTQLDLPIQPRRIRQLLNANSEFKYTKRKGPPLLKSCHKLRRIMWAEANVDRGAGWDRVIFSDE
uniref:AlNc14C109G6313 protein n=1 Tax=Albugo laibachii Nc14 TaxID=890382 RepID=F0WIA9_9STRA|nr:AlNc14C109G6313 [Albugo laibachii Nc14]|eukprot:CCA20988.1 AlNc14C109G6313 [Albugo laibachii Nc14]